MTQDKNNTISPSAALIMWGYKRSSKNMSNLCKYLEKRYIAQEEDLSLRPFSLKEKATPRQNNEYSIYSKYASNARKEFSEQYINWLSINAALFQMDLPNSRQNSNMFIAYSKNRYQRQKLDKNLPVYIRKNRTDKRQKEVDSFESLLSEIPNIKSDLMKSEFYIPQKKENEFISPEILEKLGYYKTYNNRKSLSWLMAQQYKDNKDYIFERYSGKNKVLCVVEESLPLLQKIIDQNKIDLTPQKPKNNSSKLAI